ncbi:hypothetical protein WJT74_10240 [Sphingomicrobium sp. XHP0239]|uniref:hypothetical protein n=1 Tax=Sphingomicrobium maritimum TaxID=3133972 RepID=UPI0031CC68D5
MRRFAFLLPVLALAACGDAGPLKPAVGADLPPRPVLARTTPDADDLLIPPPYARPERIDEIVTRSTPRQPDPFDLAPPEGGAAPQPDPTDVESEDVDVSDIPGPDVELDDDEE